MSTFLIKYTQKHTHRPQREALGLLSGTVGIVCNLFLFAVKLTLGILTGAVAVTADAVNNLTDAAVNIVTIAGTRLAGKPMDKEHPFGHGRAEYIAALIVAFSIFVMSFELAKSAVMKIIRPETVKYTPLYVALLLIAAGVKLWMAYFNKKLYAVTGNLNLKAVMKDSLNDSVATLATAAVLVVSGIFGLQWVDGVIGGAVAVLVFFSGVSIVRDILGPLLGEPPSKELVNAIESRILESDSILGVHDLIVHHYGPDRIIASAHAEVPADMDLMTAHKIIDRAEKAIWEELHIDICLHTDPVATDNSEQEKYKILTEIILSDFNPDFTFHDFRLTEENGVKTLSFDLVIPFEYDAEKEALVSSLCAIYRERLPAIDVQINAEHSYTV